VRLFVGQRSGERMHGKRVWAKSKIPAGADNGRNFPIISVAEGRKLTISVLSYWGGDSSEYYSLNAVPAGLPTNNATMDGDVGSANIIFKMSGGLFTATFPANALAWNNLTVSGIGSITIPGPCTLCLCTAGTSSPAVALKAVLIGIDEAL